MKPRTFVTAFDAAMRAFGNDQAIAGMEEKPRQLAGQSRAPVGDKGTEGGTHGSGRALIAGAVLQLRPDFQPLRMQVTARHLALGCLFNGYAMAGGDRARALDPLIYSWWGNVKHPRQFDLAPKDGRCAFNSGRHSLIVRDSLIVRKLGIA